MSEDTAAEEMMQEPTGQALRRIVQDEKFRAGVVNDAERALSGYDLSPEAVSALVDDAKVLSSEVSGFASQPGLKTPGVIGVSLGALSGPPIKASLACYNTGEVWRPPTKASLACYADDRG